MIHPLQFQQLVEQVNANFDSINSEIDSMRAEIETLKSATTRLGGDPVSAVRKRQSKKSTEVSPNDA